MKQITIKAEVEILATVPEGKENFPFGAYVEDGTASVWIRGVGEDEGGINAISFLNQEVIYEEDVLD